MTADKSFSSDYSIYPSYLKASPESIYPPCSVRNTCNARLEYYNSWHQIFATDTFSHLLVRRCMVFISLHRKICCGVHIVDGVKWLPTKSQWCPGNGGVHSETIIWCGSLTYLHTHQLGGGILLFLWEWYEIFSQLQHLRSWIIPWNCLTMINL